MQTDVELVATENISTFGGEVDRLFYLIYYITGFTFILVQVMMLVFLFLYRYRDGRRATYTHGNTTLEIIWTIIPALILVLLGFMSKATLGRDQDHAAEDAGDVQMYAKQFNWEILYPGPDGHVRHPRRHDARERFPRSGERRRSACS